MLRYNRLISIIRTSLINLEKAIAGLQVMSGELEKVFNSMGVGQVPDLWKGKSFPSLKPLGSYVDDLMKRLEMLQVCNPGDGAAMAHRRFASQRLLTNTALPIQDWYDHGQPSVFWLPGFFFTPSFTTAALQNFARRQKLAIDTVGFDFEMMGVDENEYTEGPEVGSQALRTDGAHGQHPRNKQLPQSEH